MTWNNQSDALAAATVGAYKSIGINPSTTSDAGGAGAILGFTPSQLGGAAGAAGSLIGGIGSYFADEAQSEGYDLESKAYTEAAGYARGNVDLAEEAKDIRLFQTQRQVAQSISGAEAVVGGSGFQLSGSGLDIIRSSMQQGALAKGLVNVQGELQAAGYRAQAAQDANLATQAKGAADAAGSKGVFDILGGVIGAGAKLLPLIPL